MLANKMKSLPDHNYKVIIEGNDNPLYFLSKQVAISTRDSCKKSGVDAWIMLKLAEGIYVPLAE